MSGSDNLFLPPEQVMPAGNWKDVIWNPGPSLWIRWVYVLHCGVTA